MLHSLGKGMIVKNFKRTLKEKCEDAKQIIKMRSELCEERWRVRPAEETTGLCFFVVGKKKLVYIFHPNNKCNSSLQLTGIGPYSLSLVLPSDLSLRSRSIDHIGLDENPDENQHGRCRSARSGEDGARGDLASGRSIRGRVARSNQSSVSR